MLQSPGAKVRVVSVSNPPSAGSCSPLNLQPGDSHEVVTDLNVGFCQVVLFLAIRELCMFIKVGRIERQVTGNNDCH